MTSEEEYRTLVGHGDMKLSWWRGEDDEVKPEPDTESNAVKRAYPRGHPAAYEASPDLVAAVNVALMLRKPLLVTGNPGTGKTELAERIAYEFGLGPVLRFEAQSLSEANDLFYRFDYIAQLVVAKLVETGKARPEDADVLNFLQWGPLGHAIRRSAPGEEEAMIEAARRQSDRTLVGKPDFGARLSPARTTARPPQVTRREELPKARQSVVLIDEIDKASRDFPNDLLNGIGRMQTRIRELGGFDLKGADRDSPHHPIVVITSNSERDLPAPFLRRCVFANIEDPDISQLASIVQRRLFRDFDPDKGGGRHGIPTLYGHLLDEFVKLRGGKQLRQPVGTAEVIDFFEAAQRKKVDETLENGKFKDPAVFRKLKDSLGAIAKNSQDRLMFERVLGAFVPDPS
jgi:MoxR-like ATPase